MSPNKSCEIDPMPTWLLKLCLDELLPIFTKIDLYWKKRLDQNSLKNYRPVSNLPFISKILEKVVDMCLEQHLTINNLHEEHQSVYRKFHSTETALLEVQNDVLQSLDQNNVTIMVLLDLSAAFNTIDQTNSSSSPRTSLWGNRKTPNMDGIIPLSPLPNCVYWRELSGLQ